MGKFSKFARIAETEFSDVVISTHHLGHKLRVYLKDKSFIDFFFSEKLKVKRFAIHWERAHIDKTIYRVDNAPDPKWKKVKGFPVHFHYGLYDKVDEPPFLVKATNLESLLRDFLSFAQEKLKS